MEARIIYALIALLFINSPLFGKWQYSERNLAAFESELKALHERIQDGGLSDELEPAFSRLNHYGFRNWLDSSSVAESRTRAVISQYNEMYLDAVLDDSVRSGIIKNVGSRLLSTTKPDTLKTSDLERLIDNGNSQNLALYSITKFLGLYEGYVEGMVSEAFKESPEEKMGLAVSLGLPAAAPYMHAFASKQFDPNSMIAETSVITTINNSGEVVQNEQTIYSLAKGGSADSIRKAAEWLLNSKEEYPEIKRELTDRLREIESFLPKGAAPQFVGLLRSASSKSSISLAGNQSLGAAKPVGERITADRTNESLPTPVRDKSLDGENQETSSHWLRWVFVTLVLAVTFVIYRKLKNE